MSKPFSKHEFHPMSLTPLSCSTCGQNKEHDNHQGRKYPKRGMSAVLKRPDWRVYADDPTPRPIPDVRDNGRAQDPGHPDGDGTGRAVGQRGGREGSVQRPGARAATADAREDKSRPEESPELPTPFPVTEIDSSQYAELTDKCEHDWEYLERKPGENYTGYCEQCKKCGAIQQIPQ